MASKTVADFALAKGSQCPKLAANTLRLYNMRFCPYAQRTRLVLEHKNIPHEIVNVNLKYKPDWLLQKNPKGLVPILEENDMVVYESGICDEYLEERFPQPALLPTDPYQRAHARILMDAFSPLASAIYGLRSRKEDKRTASVQTMKSKLGYFEEALVDKYFGGPSPGMVDYHIWPWFERFEVLKKHADMDLLTEAEYPRLRGWISSMLQTAPVQRTIMPDHLHLQFFMSFSSGSPDYDAGLQAANL